MKPSGQELYDDRVRERGEYVVPSSALPTPEELEALRRQNASRPTPEPPKKKNRRASRKDFAKWM